MRKMLLLIYLFVFSILLAMIIQATHLGDSSIYENENGLMKLANETFKSGSLSANYSGNCSVLEGFLSCGNRQASTYIHKLINVTENTQNFTIFHGKIRVKTPPSENGLFMVLASANDSILLHTNGIFALRYVISPDRIILFGLGNDGTQTTIDGWLPDGTQQDLQLVINKSAGQLSRIFLYLNGTLKVTATSSPNGASNVEAEPIFIKFGVLSNPINTDPPFNLTNWTSYNGSTYNMTLFPSIFISTNTSSIIQTTMLNITANLTSGQGNLISGNITYNLSNQLTKLNFSLSGTSARIHNVTEITVGENEVINFTVYATNNNNRVIQNSIKLTVGDTTNPILNNCTLSTTSITNVAGNTISLICEAVDASSNIQAMAASLNGTINKTLSFSFTQEKNIKATRIIFQSEETLLVGAYSINQVNVTDVPLNKISNTTKDLHFSVTETVGGGGGGGGTVGGGGGGGFQSITIEKNQTIITGQCNFNKQCEPKFGEDSFNCNSNVGGDCEFKFEEVIPSCLFDKNQQCIYRTAIFGRILVIAVIISFLILISDTTQGKKIRKVIKERLNINILKE